MVLGVPIAVIGAIPSFFTPKSSSFSSQWVHKQTKPLQSTIESSSLSDGRDLLEDYKSVKIDRRKWLVTSVGLLAVTLGNNIGDEVAMASDFAEMPALKGKDYGKTKMKYPDYAETSSGLQYKDLRAGNGIMPKKGDTVVVDWMATQLDIMGEYLKLETRPRVVLLREMTSPFTDSV